MADRTPDAEAGDAAEAQWRRRRRLAAVFGEVLPETTRDERDDPGPGDPGPGTGRSGDDWLIEQVPPHHGS